MTDKKRFNLEITEGQARIMERALDLLARVHIGQLEAIGYEVERHEMRFVAAGDTPDQRVAKQMKRERRHLLSTMLRSLNPLVTDHDNPAYRTDRNEVPDDAHAARDLEMVIRNALWKSMPADERREFIVDADLPRRTSKDHELAVMHLITPKDS